MPCVLFISCSRREESQRQVLALKEQIEGDYRSFAKEDLRYFFDPCPGFYPGGRWLAGCAGEASLASVLRRLDLDLGLTLIDAEDRDDALAARRVLAELGDVCGIVTQYQKLPHNSNA